MKNARQETPRALKKSLGIILFDKTKNNVVVIKKRYSYEYFDMVYGRYDKNDMQTVKKLVSAMTIDEKNILRSHNFDYIWYHIHLNFIKTEKYYRAYTLFTNMFMLDSGCMLDNILRACSYKNTIKLELPKGKKNRMNEPNIFTAIREMEEETQIKYEDIDLFPHIKQSMTEIKNDVKYLTLFYVGVIKKNKVPHLNESYMDQIAEIGDVKLVDMNTLRSNIDINVYKMIKHVSRMLKNETALYL
jgi:hypothetical protein